MIMACRNSQTKEYRIVSALLLAGSILGSTPVQSDSVKDKFKKIYVIIVLAFLSFVYACAINYKISLLGRESLTRVVVSSSEESLTFICISLFIFKSNFSHVDLWKNFIKKISNMEEFFKSSNRNPESIRHFVVEIFCLHSLLILILSYDFYYDWENMGLDKLYRTITYYYCFILYLAHQVTKLIKRYYVELYSKLVFIHKNILYEKRKLEELRQVGEMYMRISDAVSSFNEIFGWQIFISTNIAAIIIANDIHVQIFQTSFKSKLFDRFYFGSFPVIQIVSIFYWAFHSYKYMKKLY